MVWSTIFSISTAVVTVGSSVTRQSVGIVEAPVVISSWLALCVALSAVG